jgi:SAM-dependent methyltransferase
VRKPKSKAVAAEASELPFDVRGPEWSFEGNEADWIGLSREPLLEALAELTKLEEIPALRSRTGWLKNKIENGIEGSDLVPTNLEGRVALRREVLIAELNQIIEARTIERAKYYLKRLERGITSFEPGKINDINLLRWKEYQEIKTDSLWMLPKRDGSGAHLGWYWGNFVPQIPHQMMLRYTKKGDWVLDAFAGSGTTLIECKRLGRNGIGIELNPEVAARAGDLVSQEYNKHSVWAEMTAGDARTIDLQNLLAERSIKQIQLLMLHPPYSDIIRFSGDARDLSNSQTTENFLSQFGEALDNLTPILQKGRYCVLVIGDKYAGGEWIPLGFRCMDEVLKRGYLLKSIVVKNFEETRAKRDQKQLWRYRALVGGFYIFKHEYIIVFKKL